MPSETALAQRTEQVFERLEAQEIDALIGNLDFDFRVAPFARAALRLLRIDVALVSQLLHKALYQLVHLLLRHALQLLADLLLGKPTAIPAAPYAPARLAQRGAHYG